MVIYIYFTVKILRNKIAGKSFLYYLIMKRPWGVLIYFMSFLSIESIILYFILKKKKSICNMLLIKDRNEHEHGKTLK